ncbi:MAG: hypothetical protein U1A25_01345 [Candidatus Sungbacteria bacterium]|nr:hypothetical protein [bacterium]MDZ4260285.1 hypothetical protein [Candidatus Sungbacteria bacterium]
MTKLLFPLVLILASIAVIVLFLFPGWQHFLSVRADMRHLEEASVEFDGLIAKRDSLVGQINGISKENASRIDQLIPSGAQGPDFLVYLDQLAKSHKLVVRQLDFADTLSTKEKVSQAFAEGFIIGQIAEPLPYKTLKIIMEVIGSYESFKDFLRDVESSVRITDVTSIILSPQQPAFNFTLALQVYYQ